MQMILLVTILHIFQNFNIYCEESTPKTSSNKNHNKSRFNDDCKTAIRSRKAALQKFNLQPSAENLNDFKIHRAKTRHYNFQENISAELRQ